MIVSIEENYQYCEVAQFLFNVNAVFGGSFIQWLQRARWPNTWFVQVRYFKRRGGFSYSVDPKPSNEVVLHGFRELRSLLRVGVRPLVVLQRSLGVHASYLAKAEAQSFEIL